MTRREHRSLHARDAPVPVTARVDMHAARAGTPLNSALTKATDARRAVASCISPFRARARRGTCAQPCRRSIRNAFELGAFSSCRANQFSTTDDARMTSRSPSPARPTSSGAAHRTSAQGPAIGVLAAALLLMLATQLWAHTALRRAMPGDGDRVPSPRLLWLEFTEAIELSGTSVALADSAGAAVPLAAPAHPGDSSRVVVVAIGERLAPGRYRVTWQATSRDGHPVRGRFGFRVIASAADSALGPTGPNGGSAGGPPQQQSGADSLATRNPESAPMTDSARTRSGAPAPVPAIGGFDADSVGYVALRWLSYIMLVAGIGAVVLARITDRAATVGARHAVQTRLAAVGLTAAWLGVALALARLLAQSLAIHGPDRAMSPTLIGPLIGSSSWGHAWVIQLVGALVGVAGFTLALHDARGRAGWRIAGLAALLAAAGTALAGHAAAAEGWRAPVLVAADFLHVLAAGVWVGGVMMLAVAVLTRAAAPAVANVVRAFSPWALSSAATLVVTGILAAWAHVEEPLAPWRSYYGRVLLLKVALVVLIVLLGALNWQKLGPASSTSSGNTTLRRSVWLEVMVALAVLAATAMLVAIDPSRP